MTSILANHHAAIWKKLNIIKDDERLLKILHNYLDETTKIRPKNYVAPPGSKCVLPASGIWVFGHLASRLAKLGLKVETAAPQEVMRLLADWWVGDRKGSVVKAHHITASFHPRIVEELNSRNIPVDAILLSTFKATLARFEARYYPGETLGFVMGCHHDTTNPHAHSLLHPTTSNKTLLRTSGLKKNEPGEDKFEFLRKTFLAFARQLAVDLSKPSDSGIPPDPVCNDWLLLSYAATISVTTEAADIASDAVENYRELLAMADVRSVAEIARIAASDSITSSTLKPPSATGLSRNQSNLEIASSGKWIQSCSDHADSALSAYRSSNEPNDEPEGTLFSGDLRKSADEEMTERSVEIWDWNLARKGKSAAVRKSFAASLARYRDSILRKRSLLDRVTVNAGYETARLEVVTSLHEGRMPEFINPSRKMSLISPAEAERQIEAEWASESQREALQSKPEAQTTPHPHLGSIHVPKFRALNAPANRILDREASL